MGAVIRLRRDRHVGLCHGHMGVNVNKMKVMINLDIHSGRDSWRYYCSQ